MGRLVRQGLPLLLAPGVCLEAAGNKRNADKIGKRNVAGGLNRYTVAQEIARGRQLAAKVLRQSRTVDDPVVAEYINRLGQNLARNSDSLSP